MKPYYALLFTATILLPSGIVAADPCETDPESAAATLVGAVSDSDKAVERRKFDNDEQRRGQIDNDNLDEVSGIAVGRNNPHVLWVHNDGPADNGRKKPKIYAVSKDGTVLARVELPKEVKTDKTDFEDIAIGPCPWNNEKNCIFLADTGDNGAEHDPRNGRKHVRLLVFEEPAVPEDEPDEDLEIDIDPVIYKFEYPDHPRDSEALVITPTGIPIVITKDQSGDDHSRARLFALPELEAGGKVEAVRIGELYSAPRRNGDPHSDYKAQVTGADMTPSGDTLILRTRQFVTTFDMRQLLDVVDLPRGHSGLIDAEAIEALAELRDDDDDRHDVLKKVKGKRVRINRGLEVQGEAIAYDPHEPGFWTISEINPVLYFFAEKTEDD